MAGDSGAREQPSKRNYSVSKAEVESASPLLASIDNELIVDNDRDERQINETICVRIDWIT